MSTRAVRELAADEGACGAAAAEQAHGACVSSAVTARARNMMGDEVLTEWGVGEALAWEGLLEVARRMRRGAEDLLISRFDISVSMLGITGRLALADAKTLRQTEIAEAMGLSLSRVSRVIDILQERELVRRRSCPSDARATNVTLTRRGATLTAKAQRELFAFVQEGFVGTLSPEEIDTMARAFTRVLDAPAPGRRDAA